MNRGFGVAALLAVCMLPAAAVAQDDATRNVARDLAREGQGLFDSGKFAEAADRLGRAYELVHAPTLGVMRARALGLAGRLVAAAEAYEQVLRHELPEGNRELFEKALAEAKGELDQLKPRVPKLKVTLSGSGAAAPDLVISLNGVRMAAALVGVERSVDPGKVVVEASGPTTPSVRRLLVLQEGQSEAVDLTVESTAPPGAAPKPPPVAGAPAAEQPPALQVGSGSSQRTWGFVSLGVGAVGLGLGVVTGLSALGKKSTLDDVCKPECPQANAGDLDAYRSMRTLSYVGFGIGVIGVGVGTVLLVTAKKTAPAGAEVGLWLGPGGAGVSGVF